MNSYHLGCLGSSIIDGKHAEYVCPCCRHLVSGTTSQNGRSSPVCISLFSIFFKEDYMFDIYINIPFTLYRYLEGCGQNWKKLLNIYLVTKTSVFGNEVYYGYTPWSYLFIHILILKLLELLTLFCIFSIEEREVLKKNLKQALACKSRLTEIVDFTLAYSDKDLSVISEKLTTALKVS